METGKIKLKKPSGKKRKIYRKPVSKRFTNLESLKCFDVIKERILAGWSPARVSQFFIDEYPDDFALLSIAPKTAENLMRDYRDSISKTELLQVRMPDVMIKAREEVKSGLNEIDEFTDLYQLQRGRIDIDANTEKKIGKLFKGTGQEIKIAADILKEGANLKMDMGLIKRNLGTMEVDQTLLTDFGAKLGKKDLSGTLANPEKRKRIMGAVNMLLNASNKHPDLLKEISEDVKQKKKKKNKEND
jgi:hypothetical protein